MVNNKNIYIYILNLSSKNAIVIIKHKYRHYILAEYI